MLFPPAEITPAIAERKAFPMMQRSDVGRRPQSVFAHAQFNKPHGRLETQPDFQPWGIFVVLFFRFQILRGNLTGSCKRGWHLRLEYPLQSR
jgi:hypothetical protein